MAFSTSKGMRAWAFEDLDRSIIAKERGWHGPAIKTNMAALQRQLADPAWIDATLAGLSVPALAVLASLVAVGGQQSTRETIAYAKRYGVPLADLQPEINRLLRENLIVVLVSEYGEDSFALVSPSAARIADHLRDFDVPLVPLDTPFVPADVPCDGRALVAACSALRHLDLKVTQAGLPHRAGIKRVAKELGIGEAELEALIRLGLSLDLVEVADDGDALRPVIHRLREIASSGVLAHKPTFTGFIERLRTAGPISLVRIERLVAHAYGLPPVPELGRVPGMQAGRIGDVDVIAPVALDGTAAASITPSFEVFLPPESRHEHIVDVVSCSELVRIDRVIVARLTKASVHRCVGAGATAASILAGLDAACRTPVPANVAAAIEDWASSIKSAVTAVGRVIVVPVGDEVRVVQLLKEHVARVIAPGVIVVPTSFPLRATSTALARIGISVHTDHAAPQIDEGPRVSPDRLPPLELDTTFARRLAAYRANDAVELGKVDRSRAVPSASTDVIDPIEEGVCSDDAVVLVEEWEHRHRCTLPDQVATTLAAMLDVVPDREQQYLLAATSPRDMSSRLTKVITERGGLEAFLARNQSLVTRVLGTEISELVRATRPPPKHASRDARSATTSGSTGRAAATPPANRAAPFIPTWETHGIHARVVAAARTQSTLVLDVGGTRTPTIKITKVIERGRVTMVLGEDIADDGAVAFPLTSIVRIAEPPDAEDVRSIEATTRQPWRPSEGMRAPAGHLPCPCGSGVRFRSCCRPKN
ncbi:MAG: helicase-associated domain-containing protein [Kofleriaceae bacterium]